MYCISTHMCVHNDMFSYVYKSVYGYISILVCCLHVFMNALYTCVFLCMYACVLCICIICVQACMYAYELSVYIMYMCVL